MYQEAVRKNKILKAVRAIAKKYGIQAGDIFTVEENLLPPETFYIVNKLFDYPPAMNRKRSWVMENIFIDTKWEPSAMVKRFGKYERYNPAKAPPSCSQGRFFVACTFAERILNLNEYIS